MIHGARILPVKNKIKDISYCLGYDIKKAFRPKPERQKPEWHGRSESDLVFDISYACIEGSLKKINDFLDTRGKAGSEDVSV